MTCPEINDLEKTALRMLDYNIAISRDELANWIRTLRFPNLGELRTADQRKRHQGVTPFLDELAVDTCTLKGQEQFRRSPSNNPKDLPNFPTLSRQLKTKLMEHLSGFAIFPDSIVPTDPSAWNPILDDVVGPRVTKVGAPWSTSPGCAPHYDSQGNFTEAALKASSGVPGSSSIQYDDDSDRGLFYEIRR